MIEEQKKGKLSTMQKEEISEIGKILMEDDLYRDIIAYAEDRKILMDKYPNYPEK